MSSKSTVYEQTTINPETGEVIKNYSMSRYSLGDEPAYVKLYLANLAFFADMPPKYFKLTFALLDYLSYASAKEPLSVSLTVRIKKKILKELGWRNMASLNNALSDLNKAGVFTRIDTNTYMANPFFFGKGEWGNNALLRNEFNELKFSNTTFKEMLAKERGARKNDTNN